MREIEDVLSSTPIQGARYATEHYVRERNVSLYRANELPFHLKRAIKNGFAKNALIESQHPSRILRRLATCDDGDRSEQGRSPSRGV